jgi:hypothetical protein
MKMNSWTSVFGASGARYDFIIPRSVYELPSSPAIYMKVKAEPNGYLWKAYVGEAEDVYRRVVLDEHSNDGHRRAALCGANGVVYIPAPHNESHRRAWEKDLIKGLNPLCNIQHTWPDGGFFGGGLGSLTSGWAPSRLDYLAGILSGFNPSPGPFGRLMAGSK